MITEMSENPELKLRRVLLIDDSQTIRFFMRKIIGSEYKGVEFIEAQDGAEARSKLKTNSLDLMVADLEIKGMNGAQFVDMIRGNRIFEKKPVIIYSGSITPEFETQAKAYPKLAILRKPASPQEIYGTIETLLR